MYREGQLKNEDWGRGGLLSIAVKVNRIAIVALLFDLGLDPNEPAAMRKALSTPEHDECGTPRLHSASSADAERHVGPRDVT